MFVNFSSLLSFTIAGYNIILPIILAGSTILLFCILGNTNIKKNMSNMGNTTLVMKKCTVILMHNQFIRGRKLNFKQFSFLFYEIYQDNARNMEWCPSHFPLKYPILPAILVGSTGTFICRICPTNGPYFTPFSHFYKGLLSSSISFKSNDC